MDSPLLQYQDDRAKEYPGVEEQLDMIWHELKEKGSISGDEAAGGWFFYIKSIKDKYPKPDFTEE